MRCPECGAPTSSGYRFCGSCGARLSGPPARPARPAADPPPEPSAAGPPAPDRPGTGSSRINRVAVGLLVLGLVSAGTLWLAQDAPLDAATAGRADADRNGLYEPPGAGDLTAVRWRRDQQATAHRPLARPVVADGTAYVTNGSAVAAVEIRGGALRWRAELDQPGGPAVDEQHVYLRTPEHLFALDRADGTLAWSEAFVRPAVDLAPGVDPVVLAGAVHVAGPNGRIHAWDPDGTARWTLALGDLVETGRDVRLVGGLSAAGDQLVVLAWGADEALAIAVDPVDGSVHWATPIGEALAHPPIFLGGVVVLVARDQLVALEARTGAPRWSVELPLDTAGAPLVVRVGGNLALVTGGGELLLLDWFDGGQRTLGRWEGAAPIGLAAAGHLSGPSSGGILVHTGDGDLARFDLSAAVVRWRAPVAAGSAPSVSAGDVIVTPSREGTILGVDTGTGEVRWRAPVRDSLACDLAGGGDRTYLTTPDGVLHSFHTREGTVSWTRSDGRMVGPAVAGAAQAIALDAGVLRFLGVETGEVEASATAGGGADAGLAVGDEHLVVTGGNTPGLGLAWVRSVDLDTQRSRWLSYLDGPVAAPVTLAGGSAVAVGRSGDVVALSAASGEERWRHALGVPPAGAAVAAGETVVVQDLGGRLVALSLRDGSVRWQERLGQPLAGSPVVAAGLVVTRADHASVVAVDFRSGRRVWTVEVGVEVTSAPSVAGDRVYVGTAEGLAVVDLSSGVLDATIPLPAPVVDAPVVGPHGLVVCLASGSVLALGR